MIGAQGTQAGPVAVGGNVGCTRHEHAALLVPVDQRDLLLKSSSKGGARMSERYRS